jgi:hypothetical protein
MPKYEHPNWADITNTIFAKGIITEVYSEDDTADVTVEGYRNGWGIPLFYHCSDDAEERSNGALVGAAAAFSAGTESVEGDSVIVMCEANTGEPIRIIGFVEGIKACGSQYLCVWGIGNPGGEDCFAWDLLTNAPASIKDDSGNPVTFPIKKANISTWLSNHKELDGVEELWSRTSDTSGNWVCTPPGPLDEVYHRTCTRENTFGTSTKEEWYRYGTVEGDSDHSPMWCEGDWILSGEDSNLKGGYHYTANNGSDEVVDLTWEVSTFEQETAWGSWVEGGEPSGGRSVTESESRTYTIPIFDVIQSGSKSRSGTCETDQLSILE